MKFLNEYEAVGAFLLRRLAEVGIRHVFGVAGQYNYELLDLLDDSKLAEWVSCCNELNASYAADGYARTRGAAALLTIHGVGELSALCGIAGAYTEHVSVVVISGAPPIGEMQRNALMHQATGDSSGSTVVCAHQFCIAHAHLTAQNAVIEIDRCIRACLVERRPVYLQLPIDIAYVKVQTPSSLLSTTFQSDPDLLDAFIGLAVAKIRRSKTCAVLAGSDVDRFGVTGEVTAFVTSLNIPIAVLKSAKGVIDETIPQYTGVYMERSSDPEAQVTIDNADCVLVIGARLIDTVPGEFNSAPQASSQIFISDWFSKVDNEDFNGISMSDVVRRLCIALVGEWSREETITKRLRGTEFQSDGNNSLISSKWFWQRMESFFLPDDVILTEMGTFLSYFPDVSLPSRAKVIVQPLWGAMGYTLPATFGSLMANPSRRHLLFITPGSLQITVQELSSILQHRLKPIVFLLTGNGGQKGDAENRDANSASWRYTELCAVFDETEVTLSRSVKTSVELEDALLISAKLECCCLIQVHMDS